MIREALLSLLAALLILIVGFGLAIVVTGLFAWIVIQSLAVALWHRIRPARLRRTKPSLACVAKC